MSQAPHLRQFGGAASSCNCDAKYDQKNQAQPLRNEDEHVSMTLLGSMQLVGFVGCCESFVCCAPRQDKEWGTKGGQITSFFSRVPLARGSYGESLVPNTTNGISFGPNSS